MRALLTEPPLLTCEKSCGHENTLVDSPKLVLRQGPVLFLAVELWAGTGRGILLKNRVLSVLPADRGRLNCGCGGIVKPCSIRVYRALGLRLHDTCPIKATTFWNRLTVGCNYTLRSFLRWQILTKNWTHQD